DLYGDRTDLPLVFDGSWTNASSRYAIDTTVANHSGTGLKSLKVTPDFSSAILAKKSGVGGLIDSVVGFAFRTDAITSKLIVKWGYDGYNYGVMGLYLNSDGTFSLVRGSASSTGTFVLGHDQWCYIEVKTHLSNNSGSHDCQVFIDGTLDSELPS